MSGPCHHRAAVRVALVAGALAVVLPQKPSTAQAPIVTREVVIGARVFGPPPVAVEGVITLGFGLGDEVGWLGADSFGLSGGSFRYGTLGVANFGYRSYGWGGYWGGYGYGWPNYGSYGPRPYYYGGWYRPYGAWPYYPSYDYRPAPAFLPPIVMGAEEIFGLAAGMRMLGVAPANVPLRPEAASRAEIARDEKPAFVSNAAARQRAAKFMELGDNYFAQGNFALAYDRYASSVQAAPDLVETYLRRGQSLIAAKNYTLATETFRHAFKLHPAWSKTKFRLDDLYGKRQWEKEDHLDALAGAAEQKPTAELMFLLGAQLLYDNQPERALKFFDRAKELHQGDPLPLPAAADVKVGDANLGGAKGGENNAVPVNNIAPNNIAPNNIAPNNIAPNNIAPNNIAPNNIAPNNIAPNNIAPNNIAPNNIAPNNIAPNNIAPNNIAPNNIAPNNIAEPKPGIEAKPDANIGANRKAKQPRRDQPEVF